MKKDVYLSISKKTRALLKRQEGLDVDFKMTVKGLESTDLVAFANSDRGGTLLLGVGEMEDELSMQRGRVVGCPVGDKERLFILSKAESCVPPIDVNIIIENYARRPFYRIEIAPGKDKPYCTAAGTYKIRGDGRTNTLLPGRLLALFIENQSDIFIQRFREATKELGKSMQTSNTLFQEELQEVFRKIINMEYFVENRLNNILEGVENAEFLSVESICSSESMIAGMNRLKERIELLEGSMMKIDNKLGLLLSYHEQKDLRGENE